MFQGENLPQGKWRSQNADTSSLESLTQSILQLVHTVRQNHHLRIMELLFEAENKFISGYQLPKDSFNPPRIEGSIRTVVIVKEGVFFHQVCQILTVL